MKTKNKNFFLVATIVVCALFLLGLSPRTQEIIKALWTFEQGVVVEKTAEFNGAMIQKVSTPSFVSGTGYTIAGNEGNVFLIDNTGLGEKPGAYGNVNLSGTTVNLPTPTAALDGYELTLIKIDSGTTPMFAYCGGLPIVYASGVTDLVLCNAQGDSLTLVADFESSVSWWLKNYINR